MIEQKIQSHSDFIRLVDRIVDGQDVSSENAIRLGCAALDLTMEYHKAIVTLVNAKLYGPALAMMRPMREIFVRGIWLAECATEDQLKEIIDGRQAPGIGTMLRAVESTEVFSDKILSKLSAQKREWLHGLTHGGIEQLSRRLTETTIEPNFDDHEIEELLEYALAFGALAAINVCRFSGDARSAAAILDKVVALKP